MFHVIHLLVAGEEKDAENDIGYLVFLVITINGFFMIVLLNQAFIRVFILGSVKSVLLAPYPQGFFSHLMRKSATASFHQGAFKVIFMVLFNMVQRTTPKYQDTDADYNTWLCASLHIGPVPGRIAQ